MDFHCGKLLLINNFLYNLNYSLFLAFINLIIWTHKLSLGEIDNKQVLYFDNCDIKFSSIN